MTPKLKWIRPPLGLTGEVIAEIDGVRRAYRYRRDSEGVWISAIDGDGLSVAQSVRGFDLGREVSDSGEVSYRATERAGVRSWSGVKWLRPGQVVAGSGAAVGAAKKAAKVKAQMPGKIIRVLAAAGESVEKGIPLLVMEAMKMENEIRAPRSGKVQSVSVEAGQAVESGALLMVIEGL
jgi:biotin carboxyl carrier protein